MKTPIINILLHCIKTRVLWELFFSLFGAAWVFPFQVDKCWREGSFVSKRRKKVWRMGSMSLLIYLEGKEQNPLKMMYCPSKNCFSVYYFFWPEDRLCIKDGPSTLVGCVDWLGS